MSTNPTTAKPKTKDYQFTPKDKEWLDSKLQNYSSMIGKSIDAEGDFAAKEKEWLAAMKLGRQSARDRFKAGKILIAIQAKITDELGYPFWPWLKSMGVPQKTAERAIELTKFYKTEERLGDNTITECYAEMKAAKAKAKAEEAEDHDDDPGSTEDNGDGKLGKDTDTVSLPLSNFTDAEEKKLHNGDDGHDDEDDLGDEEEDETDEKYDQVSLLLDIDEIEDLLRERLKSMSGNLGAFPDPEKIVKKIDACVDLFDQLKRQVPTGE